ncbi:MAG: DUF4377 domain-containing protein [Anaerolineales bacterium]|nr:DUF4377 domain-containing protein [Anaerolineales bacterium]
MKLKQRILKTSILVWMLLVLVACAPTTGDLAQPVDDGGVDEDVAETAVPPTEQPSETTGDWLDITWILQSYAGQLALPDKMVTAEFMADGQLVGIGGCNNYFGSYQLDGNAISIEGVGSTEMWCEGAMDQEAAFLGMLLQAESWALADGTLTINTAAGELVFGEAAVSDESGATQAADDGVGNTAVPAPEGVLSDQYIVTLKVDLVALGSDSEEAAAALKTMAEEVMATTGGEMVRTLDIINGFVARGLTDADVAALQKNPMVRSVEPDRIITIDPIENTESFTEKTVLVGAEKVDCVGVGPQECYLVKENADDEWTYYYDEIIGFTWEPGYEYELKIRETRLLNPPADGSSIIWSLISVVSQTAVNE